MMAVLRFMIAARDEAVVLNVMSLVGCRSASEECKCPEARSNELPSLEPC